jgi:hypothetical protein
VSIAGARLRSSSECAVRGAGAEPLGRSTNKIVSDVPVPEREQAQSNQELASLPAEVLFVGRS